ncbi:MAG: cysteine hydrolase [Chloroflexota bacterium]|nr:cysteine hydrolase [Chloroflexota bacterium]
MANFVESATPFLGYLRTWHDNIQAATLDELIGGKPDTVAVVCVDVVVGFCQEGALASPRVNQIVAPIARLFTELHERGVKHFVLPQDTHEPDAVEFGSYPPHCVRGTREAETVDELKALPFSDGFTIIPKNALSAFVDTALPGWVREHPEVQTYIVTGDCTDLCTYNLALHLRMDANARQLQRRVVLVEECVDTYDVSLETAQELGIRPHPADFHHVVFLHHMEQNGVEIVKRLV